MINTSPLPTQHKTFYDYGVFLVQKWLLFIIYSPATKEINVLFDHPGQMEFIVQKMWKGQGVIQLPHLHLTYL